MKRLIFILIAVMMTGCSVGLPFGHTTTTGGGTGIQSPATQQAKIQVLLLWGGGVCGFIGLIALVAGCVIASKLYDYDDWCRSGGAALLVSGLGFLFISTYIQTFFWVLWAIVIVAVLAFGLWLWLHRTDILPYVGKAKKKGA